MAYNNYFPAGYQPAQIVYPQSPVQTQPQQTQQNNGRIYVQGEESAKSYLVAPNQTVELWDTESQTIYIKSADASGLPSIRILDYTYRESVPKTKETLDMGAFATKEDVDYLKKEIASLRANIEEKEGKKK